ncbi:psychosine receptor-like [Protopterus annectens]|uniref:psychosine receptor-like n=1 Tax=Protopterus annectens TaxID=7888 RepID=UPI001CFAF554|nr:psychosine receptor-like [Protopterus annectens]XP_043923969.1 psychosine receptor-like [Protopterus annectens]XP_043923976.1 psychosine receptor-like [Protopterus annectens]XP_043923983.1 psychosine receptor-like [Protopterus annectens]
MSNSSNSCFIFHDIDQVLFPSIYITVFILSLPANIISLYVAWLQVKKENELGIYLFSLSLADVLYTLTLPLWIDFAFCHNNWRHGLFLCTTSSFLMYTNFYSSAMFLSCISFDRYLAFVYPLRFCNLRTRKTAVIVSVAIWTIQIASNSIILWNVKVVENVDGKQNVTDEICYDTFPLQCWQAHLNLVRIILGYCLPLIIMTFCNICIYIAIKNNQATQDHEKKKIRQLLLSIVVTFFLCFTPFHVVLFIRSILEVSNCDVARMMFTPYKITLALTSLNCIADPILYSFVSEIARSDIRKAFLPHHRTAQYKKPATDQTAMATFRNYTEMEFVNNSS